MSATTALLIGPVVIPLLAACLQLLLGSRRQRSVTAVGLGSCVALVAIAVVLLRATAQADAPFVYNLGGWPARFAIVLVGDRLAALMLAATAVLALAVGVYARGRWLHLGVYLQPLLQLLLAGVNGAFLTGDLFNLFVFFELLLAASYGLELYGSGVRRVGAGLHYLVINLVASLLFLIGVALILRAAGTLNLAVLARAIPALDPGARGLLHAGAALLGMAFLTKAAIWPFGFWLPRAYSAAVAPVAAMFAIMTELGIYVLLRLSTLLFGAAAGPASLHFGHAWLLAAGAVTLAVGTIGVLGARELGKLAAANVLVSSGTLLGAIALAQPAVIAGALAYLVVSILGIGAMFLLTGLVVPPDGPEGVDRLEPYDPSGDDLYGAEDETRVVRPVPVMILSACFFACALILAGLPPLPGFLAKFALLQPMLAAGPGAIVLFALILAAGLGSIIAFGRAGIQIFWADRERVFPATGAGETAALVSLLAVCLALTVFAAEPWRYLVATAQQLAAPAQYIQAVWLHGGGGLP
jgi:multicomponent K+:H+ antiporter subunit D